MNPKYNEFKCKVPFVILKMVAKVRLFVEINDIK